MAEEEKEQYLYIPTTTQQKIISLLVIIPSLLSFIGSSLIIYHVIHDKRKTPYRRLLLGMSMFDIISTFAWLTQPFIMVSDSSNSYVWSFGNDTSCKALGTVSQTGVAAHLYNSCLSFYFVLTIRFGMREEKFAKRIEKLMHFTIITFSIGTAIFGLVTDRYYNMHVGPGCWVAQPLEGDDCANDSCGAEITAWIFAGFPALLCIFSIAINNLLLYCHVRSTVLRGQAKALEMEKRLANYKKNNEVQPEEESEDFSQKPSSTTFSEKLSGRSSWRNNKPNSVLRSSDKQWKRVKEVGTQSFLYVGSYFLCMIWTIIKQSLDGQDFDNVEGSGSVFFPLLILQSIFLPIQGFFSCVIFFRPKYLQARIKYHRETRLWCAKRAVFSEKIRPTSPTSDSGTSSQRGRADQGINYAGEMVTLASNGPNSQNLSIASNIESRAESVHDNDHDTTQSNRKKQSETATQRSYSDEDLWKESAQSTSQVFSIDEDLEISGREAPLDPGSNDTQSNNFVSSRPKRVSHTGEIEEGGHNSLINKSEQEEGITR